MRFLRKAIIVTLVVSLGFASLTNPAFAQSRTWKKVEVTHSLYPKARSQGKIVPETSTGIQPDVHPKDYLKVPNTI